MNHEQLIEKLLNKQWVISELLSNFRNLLFFGSGSEKLPTSVLTAQKYLNLNLMDSVSQGSVPLYEIGDSSLTLSSRVLNAASIESIHVALSSEHLAKWEEQKLFLRNMHPFFHAQAFKYLDGISLISNSNFRSASHPHFWGLVFLNVSRLMGDVKDCAISIIHEAAHQELFLLNLIDRLVVNSFDFSMVHAPFQGRERPPIGRMHSAHALFRMLNATTPGSEENGSYKLLLRKTIDSFQPNELTSFANRIVDSVYFAEVKKC
jgi:hypothetical protein